MELAPESPQNPPTLADWITVDEMFAENAEQTRQELYQYVQEKVSNGGMFTEILRDTLDALKMPLEKNQILKLCLDKRQFEQEIESSTSLVKEIKEKATEYPEEIGRAEIIAIKRVELNHQGLPYSLTLLVASMKPSRSNDWFENTEVSEMTLQYNPDSHSYK